MIPVDHAIRFAREHNVTLYCVDSNHRLIKKFCFFLTFIIFATGIIGCGRETSNSPSTIVLTGDQLIAQAFQTKRWDVWVESQGTIERMLADDTQGSRHQRLILRLDSGQTLLMTHNVDVAPRLPDVQPGERLAFRGEYIWNDKGGAIHWTHHDPAGRQPGGWIDYRGQRYQ
ncbi:MAG: DUF3465 domain-containing protein [Candidatus Omnitrophota bacterium]|nr:DUF3465 domain-containing protein [Candidatus Omnitrophota bacterium]